jgi:flagellar basal-body rod protein FlgG
MDVITNNLANIETNGYKKDLHLSRSFNDMLLTRLDNQSTSLQNVGPLNYGIHTDEVLTDYSQGTLVETGEKTDFTILGDGFFSILTPQGIRYTRSGNFKINSEGYLVTNEGYYVSGNNGRINVGDASFQVDKNGNIISGEGVQDRFLIARFNTPENLVKAGNNLYESMEAPVQANGDTGTFQVARGSLEGSNVDLTDEMVRMIEVSRSYETNQYIMRMIDETYKKSVNEIGRL